MRGNSVNQASLPAEVGELDVVTVEELEILPSSDEEELGEEDVVEVRLEVGELEVVTEEELETSPSSDE